MAKSKKKPTTITWRDFVPPILFKINDIITESIQKEAINTTQIGLSIFFLSTVLLTILITNIIPTAVANVVYSINVATYKLPAVKNATNYNASNQKEMPSDVLGVTDEQNKSNEHNEVPVQNITDPKHNDRNTQTSGSIQVKEEPDGRWISFTIENPEKSDATKSTESTQAAVYYSYSLE